MSVLTQGLAKEGRVEMSLSYGHFWADKRKATTG